VWLHAASLTVPRSGEILEVVAPLPDDLRHHLGRLGEPKIGRIAAV
jgi:hypothetical protein